MKYFDWDDAKNAKLRAERGIGFEDVVIEAVKLGYKIADEQILRGQDFARRLRGASQRSDSKDVGDLVDHGLRLARQLGVDLRRVRPSGAGGRSRRMPACTELLRRPSGGSPFRSSPPQRCFPDCASGRRWMPPSSGSSGASLRAARLDGADLRGANLEGVDLSGAGLSAAILIEANFTAARLENAGPSIAT